MEGEGVADEDEVGDAVEVELVWVDIAVDVERVRMDVAVEMVDGVEDEEEEEEEGDDGVGLTPRVAKTLTSPAVPQQFLELPQHQVSEVAVPSQGVICTFPASMS